METFLPVFLFFVSYGLGYLVGKNSGENEAEQLRRDFDQLWSQHSSAALQHQIMLDNMRAEIQRLEGNNRGH